MYNFEQKSGMRDFKNVIVTIKLCVASGYTGVNVDDAAAFPARTLRNQM